MPVIYDDAVVNLLGSLIPLADDEDGVGGYVQDTACAVLAFNSVGGAARRANDMGRWFASKQAASGGWIELDGREYPEVDGEALSTSLRLAPTSLWMAEPGLALSSSRNGRNVEALAL
jgi:hypothetical protein